MPMDNRYGNAEAADFEEPGYNEQDILGGMQSDMGYEEEPMEYDQYEEPGMEYEEPVVDDSLENPVADTEENNAIDMEGVEDGGYGGEELGGEELMTAEGGAMPDMGPPALAQESNPLDNLDSVTMQKHLQDKLASMQEERRQASEHFQRQARGLTDSMDM